MTAKEFFGCTFIAYGPAFALFIFTIAREPLRIIILIAGCFFWLLSLLFSSVLWNIVWPLKDQLAFGVVFSVLFQEVFRFFIYKLLRKADEGLQTFSDEPPTASDKHMIAYVAGLGFGLMSGAFSLVNVIAMATGPGTVGIHGDTPYFFLTSALMTSCFILLHTFWNVIFFWGCDKRNIPAVLFVVGFHMLISCLTLIRPLQPATIIPAYCILLVTMAIAYKLVGGSIDNLTAFLFCKRAGYASN
ncbi:APH1A [Branchiostoma lanceolatum]|uniref:APH1A protein n=1 Tax=Branchiostoma lanceolatum TaxID=7740 RepID=A0A8K0EHT1_BRALA|nr:APH1A [Branchiostoma lanceolatum]